MIRNSYPKLIDTLFNDKILQKSSSISYIQQYVKKLLVLNHAINEILPKSMCSWFRVINFRKGILILETANASWLMRFNYEKTKLLYELQKKTLPSLSSIEVKINPNFIHKENKNIENRLDNIYSNYKTSKKLRTLSIKSAECILNIAVQSEGKLKKLLERLSKLAK